MSTTTKQPTKTISLRLPLDLAEFLERKSAEVSRSKSNYIKWLIDQDRKHDVPTIKLSDEATTRIEKALDDHYAGKSDGIMVSTDEELDQLLTRLSKEANED